MPVICIGFRSSPKEGIVRHRFSEEVENYAGRWPLSRFKLSCLAALVGRQLPAKCGQRLTSKIRHPKAEVRGSGEAEISFLAV